MRAIVSRRPPMLRVCRSGGSGVLLMIDDGARSSLVVIYSRRYRSVPEKGSMRRDYPVQPVHPPSCAIGLREYPRSRPLASHLGLVPTPIFPSRLLPIPPSTFKYSTHIPLHHSNIRAQRSIISYRTHIEPPSLSGHGNTVQLHHLLYWGGDQEEVLTTTHDLTVYHLSKGDTAMAP